MKLLVTMDVSVPRELCKVSGTVLRDAGVKLEYIYIKGRSAVFISPLKTIKRKVKRQRANQLVAIVESVVHAPEQIATTKRVSTPKSLKFTDISGNISVSSTLTRSTRLKAKLDKYLSDFE